MVYIFVKEVYYYFQKVELHNNIPGKQKNVLKPMKKTNTHGKGNNLGE